MAQRSVESEVDGRAPESAPLTDEEKEAIREYLSGDEEAITFKTVEEAFKWLNE